MGGGTSSLEPLRICIGRMPESGARSRNGSHITCKQGVGIFTNMLTAGLSDYASLPITTLLSQNEMGKTRSFLVLTYNYQDKKRSPLEMISKTDRWASKCYNADTILYTNLQSDWGTEFNYLIKSIIQSALAQSSRLSNLLLMFPINHTASVLPPNNDPFTLVWNYIRMCWNKYWTHLQRTVPLVQMSGRHGLEMHKSAERTIT